MPRIRSTATAVAVTLGLSLVAVAPAQAAKKKAPAATKAPVAKTVTACVNKKSGATKVLLGKKATKKCAKGWTKTTWNVSGTNGANGTNGVNGTNGTNGANGITGANGQPLGVRDAAGNRLGTFAGLGVAGIPIPIIQVLGSDGGLYPYLETGQYFPMFSSLGTSGSPVFRDASCAGTAYFPVDASSWNTILSKFVGGTLRFGFRTMTGGTFDATGAARTWKLTTTTAVLPPVLPALYTLDVTGACWALVPPAVPHPGDLLVTLESIPAPADGVGRLTIG